MAEQQRNPNLMNPKAMQAVAALEVQVKMYYCFQRF